MVDGSPAINAGIDDNCPTADQRNLLRDDGQCDVDAFAAGAAIEAPEEDDGGGDDGNNDNNDNGGQNATDVCYTIRAANGKVLTFCL